MTHRKMKDSGIEWIGMIPEDWKTVKTKDAFDRKNSKANVLEPTVLSLARDAVKVRDISNNEGQLASDYSNYNPVKFNDLLLNPMDLISGDNCNIAKVEGVISPAYINLRHKKDINPEFYNFYFKHLYWTKVMFSHGKGVSYENRWTLNYETLSNMMIPLPSVEEQDNIQEFLSSKIEGIAESRKNIENQIQTLENYKKSIITEAVTKGLDKNVEMKDSGIEWIGEIPKHWELKPNKVVMSKIKNINKIFNGEKILSLSKQGVVERNLEEGGKMPSSFDGYQKLYKDNLLMCLFDYDVTPRCIGYIGDDGITSPAYSQFVMKNNNLARYYYYYYLMIDMSKEILHLSKNLRSSFTEDEIGRLKVPKPPQEEQYNIACYLDKVINDTNTVINQKKQQLETLEQYKKSLIFEYVTGKKEVPHA